MNLRKKKKRKKKEEKEKATWFCESREDYDEDYREFQFASV